MARKSDYGTYVKGRFDLHADVLLVFLCAEKENGYAGKSISEDGIQDTVQKGPCKADRNREMTPAPVNGYRFMQISVFTFPELW